MPPKLAPRERAFTLLKNVLINHHPLEFLEEDDAWTKALCFGILKQKFSLDALLEGFLKRPPGPKEIALRLVLYIGLYPLLFMQTKAHANVFETVELAKKLHLPHPLINAVLRNILRQPPGLLDTLPETIRLNHPDWLIELIRQDHPKHWREVLLANNTHPPFFLRVNLRQTTREAYLELLHQHGIAAQACTMVDTAIYLEQAVPVALLPHFYEGWVSVQDLAAQACASLLAPAPHDKVLDACAAPGGKACHLLEYADINLLCLEQNAERATRIHANLQRLQLHAEVHIADSRTASLPTEHFDCILVDAPCSGLGVIRRHPDIRYLKSAADFSSLTAAQWAILEHVWPSLKPGGKLLYATCSVIHAENADLINHFLQTHPEATPLPIHLTEGHPSGHGWQLLPSPQGPDGFFYALLKKQGSSPK
jgi:16S rRNA (cytosine967-C5)-methyltransferase